MALPDLSYDIIADDAFSRTFSALDRQVKASDGKIAALNASIQKLESQRLLEVARAATQTQRAQVELAKALAAEERKQIEIERGSTQEKRQAVILAQQALEVERQRTIEIRQQTKERDRQSAEEYRTRARAQQASPRVNAGPGPGLGTALSGLGRGLVGAGVGALAGLGAREIIQFAESTARLQSANKRTSDAFELLSGSAENAEAKLKAVRRASGGAIDDVNGMAIANKAAALGFASTASELERVTKFATVTGRLLGVDTVTALDNIASATANLSFVRLDQMGVSASEVRKRFNELKGTMSESEAFLQATLEVGERTFSSLEDSSLTAASGSERLAAQLTNIKNTLAEPVGQGVNSVAGFLATILGSPVDIDQRFNQGVNQIQQNIEFSSQYAGLSGATERDQQKLEILGRIEAAAKSANDAIAEGGLPPEAIAQLTSYRDELLNTGSVIVDMPELPAEEVQAQIAQMIGAVTGLRIAWGVTKAELEAPVNMAMPALGMTPGQFAIQRYQGNQTTDKIQSEVRDRQRNEIAGQLDEQLRTTRAVNDAQFRLSLATTDTAGQLAMYEGKLSTLEAGTVDYINTQVQIANLQGRLADQTEKAGGKFISSLNQMESAFMSALSAIGGIPGFSGRTAVTEEDMRLAAAGLYRDKPDEFLRRAEDLLINGTQRNDINRKFIEEAVAASTGFDAKKLGGIQGDLLFKLLEEEFTSARLFGTEFGRANFSDLINQQGIAFGLQQQGQANMGRQFLESQFKNSGLPGIFANAGGFAGQLEEQLNNSGFASQVGSIFNGQLTNDKVLSQIDGAAPAIYSRLESAILDNADGSNTGLRLVLLWLSQMQQAETEVSQ